MKNNNKNSTAIIVFATLFLLAVLSRWVGHFWNFTLLGGAFLFAGAYFTDKKIAVLLMLAVMLVSDLVIGFHDQMPIVYFSYLVVVALGFLMNPQSSRLKILGYSVLGSFAFYVLTNFAVWYQGALYPMTFSGLIECYVMGIPFYRNQIISDVAASFGFFEIAKRIPSLVTQMTDAKTKK